MVDENNENPMVTLQKIGNIVKALHSLGTACALCGTEFNSPECNECNFFKATLNKINEEPNEEEAKA